MKKIICALMTLSIVLFGCSKYEELETLQEAQDTCRIAARMFLYDTLSQQGQFTAQPKKRITISAANQIDTLNYLYSATTDDNGYFQFKYLTRNKSYRLVYEESIGGVLYRGDTIIIPPSADFPFIVSPSLDRQRGIYYTIVNGNNQSFPRASVCIFDNVQAYLGGKCENANHSLTSDAYGRVFLAGLPQNTYYTIATVKVGNANYTVRDTVVISNGVVSKTLTVAAPPSSSGIQYTIKDPDGFVVKGAKVCLFFNPDFALSGMCEGSNYSDSTDVSGKVSFTGLEPSTFHVNAYFKIGSQVYKKSDVLIITDNIIQQKILQLQ
jgi:hypothetical protein